MILVDPRIGSGDLYPALRQLGIPAEVMTLECADVAWFGRGPKGVVPVGVEVKTVSDLVSSLTSGRLVGGQVPCLTRSYPYVWLLVEGPYRAGEEGLLEVPRGQTWQPLTLGARRVQYHDLESFLTTLEIKTGIHCRRTYARRETVALIASLYRWWTAKAFDDHRGHLTIYQGQTQALVPMSLKRQIAATLPGVGFTRSGAVADYFPSVRSMVEASEDDWAEVPGIGTVLATRIVKVLRAC